MAGLENAGRRSAGHARSPIIANRPRLNVERLIPLGLLALLLIIWQALASSGAISALFFPPPSQIAAAALSHAASGELWEHVGTTLWRLTVGMLMGTLPGLVIGLLLGRAPFLRRIFDPVLAALHPIPKISVFPLLIIVLGIGEEPSIAVIALSAFFPVVINVMEGVRQINPTYFEIAQHFGAGVWQQFVEVIFPGSLPLIMAGIRLALNSALMVTIAAELLTARAGLGAMIANAWYTLNTEDIYIAIVIISTIGVMVNTLQNVFNRWVAPWTQDKAL